MIDNIAVIPIYTGIPEKVGIRPVKTSVPVENAVKEALKKKANYYVFLPDLLMPYKDYIRGLVQRFKGRDAIVVVGRPNSLFSRLLGSLAYNPLSELTGDNLSLALVVSRSLLLRASAQGLRNILDKAAYVTKFVYREPLYDYVYMVIGRFPKALILTLFDPVRTIKFALVGLSGVLINYIAVAVSLTYLLLQMSYVSAVFTASIIGFEVSLTWNFIIHELWTFKDLNLSKTPGALLWRWIKYHIGSIGSFIAQTGTITLLTGYMSVELYKSILLGVTLGFIVNYLAGRLYTWRE
jgi:dolichol-phosphate mannosyltransferase